MAVSGGIILYGAPGVGKDTVTRHLARLNGTYRLFKKIKSGPGRVEGYRSVDAYTLSQIRRDGGILYESSRYGATYVIDRAGLRESAVTSVPVVHLGQHEGVVAILAGETHIRPWTQVELICDREVARQRIEDRETGDVDERMRIFDQTPRLPGVALALATDQISPDEAAERIIAEHAQRQNDLLRHVKSP